MKPYEILAALPEWSQVGPEKIVESPAWAMPCRLGEKNVTMRFGALLPADSLNLAVKFDGEDNTLSIAVSPFFHELHAIWGVHGDVPDAIILALVEKECGALLQLVENAVRKQLKIVGLGEEPQGGSAGRLVAELSVEGEEPIIFAFNSTASIATSLGILRYIDLSHPAVRETALPAKIEYAVFTLTAAELAGLAQGDALLLPETATIAPRLIVDGRFAMTQDGVEPWSDDGRLRAVAAEETTVKLGELLDAAVGTPPAERAMPTDNAPLALLRGGKVVASGRFSSLAEQKAFFIDSAS